jgi:hypothetical protein
MAISPSPQRLQPKIINQAKKGQKSPYVPANKLVSTPKQEQATTQPSKVTSSKTGWILLGGGLASLAILVGFFNRKTILSWFEKAKTPAVLSLKSTENIQPTSPSINLDAENINPASPNITSTAEQFKPKRSLDTVKALCEAVMEEGNGSLACQTMAFFNSLRLFSELAETEPGFSGSIDTARIKTILGTQSNEALKTKAFDFLKKLKLEVFQELLANNRVNSGKARGGDTTFMQHFLTCYAFNSFSESMVVAHNRYSRNDMISMLIRLCSGEVGQLGGNPFRGAHSVSLVGIHEDEAGKIDALT